MIDSADPQGTKSRGKFTTQWSFKYLDAMNPYIKEPTLNLSHIFNGNMLKEQRRIFIWGLKK